VVYGIVLLLQSGFLLEALLDFLVHGGVGSRQGRFAFANTGDTGASLLFHAMT